MMTKEQFIEAIKRDGSAKVDADIFREWFGISRIHDAGLTRALTEIRKSFTMPDMVGLTAVHLHSSLSAAIPDVQFTPSILVYRSSDAKHTARL